MNSTKGEELWTTEFLGMSLSNFLIYITQYAMIAGLPIIIMTEYGGGDVEAGLAMTFFQIGTVAARPCAGILIDAVNKRRLMIVITVLFFLLMCSFAFAATLSTLYGLRLVHGVIFAVATTTAAALAALILPPARKGEGIGYFALSTNLAMVAGPMIGLLILEYFSPTVLFSALGVLAAISIAAGGAHRLPDEIILPAKTQRTLSVSTFIERRALAPALIAGILFFAYGSVLTFIPLYTRSLGLSAETSLFYACYAGAILVTRPFVGRIFDRKGSDYTVYPGLVLFAAGMFLLGNIEGLSGLIAAAVFLGAGFGAVTPALQTLAVRSAPPARAGVATATYFWSLDISVGLAAAGLGVVAVTYGYAFTYSIVDVAVIAVGALCYALWRRSARM
ncbi:transporter, major facilitator family protein [Selenomonas sp. FOBRC6]|uniref:MFS transporter n=1 Tax=Selenomonas sp. FOBRC6 TaxID=936572 RepID=UPI00027819F7|nr:MFS transporter [Selenomonas sp. FOBRC6]EJO22212.1 transporter, major facilitator family protein [Selenomonas sp. FOBRC6]